MPRMYDESRIGDWWRYGISLRALCLDCGAERQIPPARILTFFGGDEHRFNLDRDGPRLANALVCGSCKAKGRATVRLVKG
jgi:hypothetical protein